MKKSLIALLLTVFMAFGIIGTVPVHAVEADTQGSVSAEETTAEGGDEDNASEEMTEQNTETESEIAEIAKEALMEETVKADPKFELNQAPPSISRNSSTDVITAQGENTDYVTPQMFGAISDDWIDDTAAIQRAIDSNKSVYFPKGEYIINSPIVITNKRFWSMNAQNAVITYNGTDYALRILNAVQNNISVGMVYATAGGGIEFYSDSRTSWNQYNSLTFNAILAKTDCIHIETSGEGWSNENQIYGGQFASGENGVNVVSRSNHTINGWKFYNCGIEGVKNGFMFDATVEEIGAICNMAVVNSRYAESFGTILKTVGTVFDCIWISPTYITKNIIDCSPQTTRFEIYAPIGTYWHLHDTAFHRGCIINGELMGEVTEFQTVE